MPTVQRWDIITIGNVSRNRYWGEPEGQPVRSALCTCTLITGDGFRLLVDPSLGDDQQMARELNRRTGLRPNDVTAVFVTHAHGDHHAGLTHFAEADWLAADDVAARINELERYGKQVQKVRDSLFGVVDVIPTPGHTADHHSLRFDCDGRSVVVAGDAVMTRDFWTDRRGYFNSVDFDLAAGTMDELARMADIIVPGHDNDFLVAPTKSDR